MKYCCILIIFLSLAILSLQAQQEAMKWYFGEYCALDFSSGAPIPAGTSAMNKDEGCASMSDGNGTLLFYTSGIDVWNKNHQQMPNGFGLTGHESSTQSALIVPKPGSTNIFYIFTVDAFMGSGGLRYSIVDMNQLGGLGNVTTKNVLLTNPATEKLTAVKHSNNTDYWVIAHKGIVNAYYAYLVNSTGINTTPVISNVGTTPSGNGSEIGYLQASPDGSKLAAAIYGMSLFELLDFNNTTGIVSNAITSPGIYPDLYGIEFSPNGNLLYISSDTNMYQFDLQAGSATAIFNSAILIGTFSPPFIGQFIGAIKLAPDQKIYFTTFFNTYLGVINNPNNPGTSCNYNVNGAYLGGQHCYAGLPNFYKWPIPHPDFTSLYHCLGDTTIFSINDSTLADSVIWDFDDPASGSFNIAYGYNSWHVYNISGNYNVLMIVYNNGIPDTITHTITIYSPPVIDLGNDTSLCEGSSLSLSPGNTFSSYIWQDGSTNTNYVVNQAGTYWVEVSDGFCTSSDTIIIYYHPCDTAADNYIYVYFPNAFSPNENHVNDEFRIYTSEEIEFEMYIYNKWGQLIFESNDINHGWDGRFNGKVCQSYCYIWLIKCKAPGNQVFYRNGENKLELSGHVMLFK